MEQTLQPVQPQNIESFKAGVNTLIESRQYFIEKVLPIMKEKQDYYEILGKKCLAKGGAEKLASIWNLTAKFERDDQTIQMLGDLKGLVAFRCDLYKGESHFGQGRGADTLARNQNDPNKTIKMAQKRAYVDAVIRATGLSDIFTQDLEDSENGVIKQETPKKVYPASERQLKFIQSLAKQKGVKKISDVVDIEIPVGQKPDKEQAKKIIEILMQLPAL